MTRIRMAAALFLAAALAALTLAGPASATTTTPGPSFETCANLAGWYVNPDETDRRPTATVDGLKFEGNDLIHHAAATTLEDLNHGTFAASPQPDQTSFFSVEVSGDGKYGTLRWNSAEGYWEATSQGEQHHDVSPVALADAFPIHLSHKVVSFGVGYTNTPPGTVATVVSSVSFSGKTYALTCAPVVQTTSPAPHTSSTSPAPHSSSTTPKPHNSSSTPAGAVHTGGPEGEGGSSLPVTGPSVGWIVGLGVLVLGTGAGLIFLSRRRKVTFEH